MTRRTTPPPKCPTAWNPGPYKDGPRLDCPVCGVKGTVVGALVEHPR